MRPQKLFGSEYAVATPPDANTVGALQSVGGALVLLAGAIGVAAWSYIKARLLPEVKAKAEATLVGGVIGGNELRLVVEALARLESIGQQANAKLDDCRDAAGDVERAVRDHAASAARDASNAASALTETHKEARRAADLVDRLMRQRPPAADPTGRWTPG